MGLFLGFEGGRQMAYSTRSLYRDILLSLLASFPTGLITEVLPGAGDPRRNGCLHHLSERGFVLAFYDPCNAGAVRAATL